VFHQCSISFRWGKHLALRRVTQGLLVAEGGCDRATVTLAGVCTTVGRPPFTGQ